MAGEGIPVEVACRVLDVSVSGYYAWLTRAPSPRAIRHAWLTDLITEVHQHSTTSNSHKTAFQQGSAGFASSTGRYGGRDGGRELAHRVPHLASGAAGSAHRSKRAAHLLDEQCRLLEGGEVAASVKLLEEP